MYPVPNCAPLTSTCNSYTTPSAIRRQRQTTIDGRIDQHFNDTNTFYARYDINDSVTQIPPSFPNVTLNPTTGYPEAAGASGGVTLNPGSPGFGGVNGFPGSNYTRGQQFALSFVHVFSPDSRAESEGRLHSSFDSFAPDQPGNRTYQTSSGLRAAPRRMP